MSGGHEADYDDGDAASLIQVAISRQQSRLVSPRTPLLDKVEALKNSQGFFEQPDEFHIPVTEDSYPSLASQQPQDNQTNHTDSLRVTGARSNDVQRSGDARSLLRDGFKSRQRSSSGPERIFETLQKAVLSIPKRFSTSIEQAGQSALPPDNQLKNVPTATESPERDGLVYQQRDDTTTDLPALPQFERLRSGQPLRLQTDWLSPTDQQLDRLSPSSPQLYRTKSGRPSLRRSFSDDSLAVSRTFSQASSLGDDSRFEHVQNQVNSRMKAIKDTWQDRNIKLPSLSSLKPEMFRSDDSIRLPSLASFKPDFLRSSIPPRSMDHTTKPVDPITRQPFQSAEALHDDLKRSPHTYLDQALASLEGDVIVLGGYRGSVLRSAKPPHKQLWVPIKVGLNLRKVDLEVGIAEEDDLKPAVDVIADGMLKHIGPVDISARLLRRLKSSTNAQSGKLRVHDYGYDWRLDPTYLSKQLCKFVEGLGAKVTVIAHSLGGLVTRHAINQRPELFRGVVYAGVPTRCVNILGPLRNGDDVLLSSRVLTAQVNFTIRTSFALLPLDGRCFINKHTREEYRVDFFDPETWREHRLSPCINRPLPAIKAETGIAAYVSTVTKALPLPNRRSITARPKSMINTGVTEPGTSQMSSAKQGISQISFDNSPDTQPEDQAVEPTVSTTVTIDPDEAFRYLSRTLANVKRFKQELTYRPELAQSYPPIAVIYGKNTPTVVGARVVSRDAIKRTDAYDDLAFASGDGVVLARAAMLPKGYTVAKGGLISSERGHVSLLADLDAVGKALLAIAANSVGNATN